MKLITNLNGDFFCPFQTLVDIAEQMPDAVDTQFKQRVFAPICELNTTNDWINLEALGKSPALQAQAHNELLKPTFVKNEIEHMELHINTANGIFTIDNVYAMLFLADSLNTLELFFYAEQPHLEKLQQWTQCLTDKSNIKTNYKNIENFTQDDAFSVMSEQLEIKRYEALNSVGFDFYNKWFESMNAGKVNPGILIGFAWTCLKAGAYAIGETALTNALASSSLSDAMREQLFMHLQLIRFLSHQYEVVTNEIFPENFQFLEKYDAINLNFIKAYSATLSRNLNVAETYFKKCNVDKNMELTDEASLYQLNLHALFQVLNGDMDLAFELEMRIKSFIEKNHVDVLGLKYVNFINIARLYKKSKQYDESLKYYEKAYNEISGGGYTPSDHIYYNFNLGSLYESAGEDRKAFFYWVKAAVHWLSIKNPYALSWRPRLILCQEKMTDVLTPLSTDKVNTFLFDKINVLISKANITLENKSQKIFNFATDDQRNLEKTSCYVAEGVVLYDCCSSEPLFATKQTETESGSQLTKLVSNIIQQFVSIPESKTTLVIDTKGENFYPKSDEACWALAKLSGCDVCYHDGKRITFDDNQISHLLNNVKLSLSKTISAVNLKPNKVELRYKRSFLNKTLHSQDEIELVTQLNNEKAMNLKYLQSYPKATLASLVDKHVTNLEFSTLETGL